MTNEGMSEGTQHLSVHQILSQLSDPINPLNGKFLLRFLTFDSKEFGHSWAPQTCVCKANKPPRVMWTNGCGELPVGTVSWQKLVYSNISSYLLTIPLLQANVSNTQTVKSSVSKTVTGWGGQPQALPPHFNWSVRVFEAEVCNSYEIFPYWYTSNILVVALIYEKLFIIVHQLDHWIIDLLDSMKSENAQFAEKCTQKM